MGKFDEHEPVPGTPNNNVVMIFTCSDESEVYKVMEKVQPVMIGLMLDGITVVITRGED